ncbi:GAF domain-containing protein [Actinocatenispora rupis]|uniref:GAF domain-containing protein n=1 Tax=Actinocatenispora rupis TaxID=519421 RepID=A0A8J3NF64_9ACTN|nr:GAF domain-containing protein [Actinocatenispora rupis]
MSDGPQPPGDAYADAVDDQRNTMVAVFAAVTAHLVDEYDAGAVLDLIAEGSAEVLQADAGILLRDAGGDLRVAAASNESARLAEMLQSHTDEGPCVDTISTGDLVRVADLRGAERRWPLFTTATLRVGYASVYSVPVHVEDETIGGLNLFCRTSTVLGDEQIRFARVLADLAALALTQPSLRHRREQLAERTLATLNDRVEIDHAVGLLAGATDLDAAQAATVLFDYARRVRLRPVDVARALVGGSLPPRDVAVGHLAT